MSNGNILNIMITFASQNIHLIDQWFSIRGDFYPPSDISNYLETFVSVTDVGVLLGI